MYLPAKPSGDSFFPIIASLGFLAVDDIFHVVFIVCRQFLERCDLIGTICICRCNSHRSTHFLNVPIIAAIALALLDIGTEASVSVGLMFSFVYFRVVAAPLGAVVQE